MDIILLRQTLKELNPLFWNAVIDSQLKDSKYPNRSPVESAFSRYTVTLRNEKGKNRIKELFKEVENCLIPYDKAYEVLLKEFPNPFAQQMLLTNENLILNFAGVSTKTYNDWVTLVVCMSHEDFWADKATMSVVKQGRDAAKSYQQFLKDKRSEIEDLDPVSPETKDVFMRHIDGYIEWHNNNPEEALHINDVPVSEKMNLLQNSVKRAHG